MLHRIVMDKAHHVFLVRRQRTTFWVKHVSRRDKKTSNGNTSWADRQIYFSHFRQQRITKFVWFPKLRCRATVVGFQVAADFSHDGVGDVWAGRGEDSCRILCTQYIFEDINARTSEPVSCLLGS